MCWGPQARVSGHRFIPLAMCLRATPTCPKEMRSEEKRRVDESQKEELERVRRMPLFSSAVKLLRRGM